MANQFGFEDDEGSLFKRKEGQAAAQRKLKFDNLHKKSVAAVNKKQSSLMFGIAEKKAFEAGAEKTSKSMFDKKTFSGLQGSDFDKAAASRTASSIKAAKNVGKVDISPVGKDVSGTAASLGATHDYVIDFDGVSEYMDTTATGMTFSFEDNGDAGVPIDVSILWTDLISGVITVTIPANLDHSNEKECRKDGSQGKGSNRCSSKTCLVRGSTKSLRKGYGSCSCFQVSDHPRFCGDVCRLCPVCSL